MDGKKAFQFYMRQARNKPRRHQPAAPTPADDAAFLEPEDNQADAPKHDDEVQQFIAHLMQHPPVTGVKVAPSGDLMLFRGNKREVMKAPTRSEGISKDDWAQLADMAKLVAEVKNAVVDVNLRGATLLIKFAEGEDKEISLSDLIGGGGGSSTTIEKGWSPVFAVAEDGERRVLQVANWTGGGGTRPATGKYLGPEGFVDDIANATNIRGAAGGGSGGASAVYVGPEAAAPATVNEPTLLILRETGAAARDTRMVIREPAA